MAKVIAPFKLRGSIGDLTFYENEYGPQVKTKSSPTKWHMEHHKGFANARRNAAEFKRAGKGAELLRKALGKPLLKGFTNIRSSGRMISPMVKAVKADPIHSWGERDLVAGDPSVLEGFEFNHKLELDDALPLNIDNCYTVDKDNISLQLPAFRLRQKKCLPDKATHYRVVSALITVDFGGETYTRDIQRSPVYAMGRKAGAAFAAEHTLAPGKPGQFWLVGVEFLASDAGNKVLKGGALRVVRYVRPVEEEMVAGEEERQDDADDRVATIAVEAAVPAKNAGVVGTAITLSSGEPVEAPVAQDHGLGSQSVVQVQYAVSQPVQQAGISQSAQPGWRSSGSTVTTAKGCVISYSFSL